MVVFHGRRLAVISRAEQARSEVRLKMPSALTATYGGNGTGVPDPLARYTVALAITEGR